MRNHGLLDWPKKPLKKFIDDKSLFSDGDWVESKDQDEAGNNRLIQLADIGEGNFINKSARYMNDEQFKRLRCTALIEGDILIARMPDPIGRACFFPSIKEQCATVVDVAILRNPSADSRWLVYSINSAAARKQIESLSAGSTRTRISKNLLAEIFFPTPPPEVQRAISTVLQTIDTAIKKTEALIGKYQQIKAGLMHDLFTRGIGADGKLRPPREQAPELYKKTSIGWMPKEWGCERLGSLLAPVPNNLRSGPFGSALLKSELVENGIPFLGIDNVFVERFESKYRRFVSDRKFMQLAKYAVRPKDVIITIMGTVGRSAVVPDDIGTALSSKHLWAMTFNQDLVVPELVCWQLNYAPWVKARFRKETQGGIMDAIQSKTLKGVLLPLPDPDEQKLIHDRYNVVSQKISSARAQLAKLEKQKSGLMHDLLTGKTSVPENLLEVVAS